MTSRRLLLGFSALAVMLMIAGAVSFVRYTRRHAPQPWLVAVTPFDIFVPGLEEWRVRLAEGLTEQLNASPPLTAVSQNVVRQRWRGQSRPEIAAVELARRTGAGLAIYGRVDPLADRADSARVQLILIDAVSARVLLRFDRHWLRTNLQDLPRAVAEGLRQWYVSLGD